METSIELSGGVPALFVASDDPLFTFYDDGTGERTSLSAAELRAWVGRTANLLVEGCGLNVGARAAALLSPHWHSAAVLLGTWSAGVSVEYLGEATAGLPRVGPGSDKSHDVVFAAAHRIGNWIDDVPPAPHRFVVSGYAEGYRDYLAEVAHYGDEVTVAHGRSDAASVDGTSYAEWALLAHGTAESLGIRPGDRVLIDATEHQHPVMWLLAPLAVGASVVVCAHLDPTLIDAKIKAERITRIL